MKKKILPILLCAILISSCGQETKQVAKTVIPKNQDPNDPIAVADEIVAQYKQNREQAYTYQPTGTPKESYDFSAADEIAQNYTNSQPKEAEKSENDATLAVEDFQSSDDETILSQSENEIDEAAFIAPDTDNITDIDRKYLHENAYDYEGKWVRIAGVVQAISERDDGTYSVAFSGPSAMKNIYCYMNPGQEKLVTDGEFATIVGRVGTKLIGQLAIENCYVENTGHDAETFNDKMTASAPKDETQQNSSAKKDEGKSVSYNYQEYTASDYESILRNPDNYNDKPIKLSGTVSQVIEGWLWSDSIIIEDGGGNRWVFNYHYGEGESHVLEGDRVTVYGTLNGTTKAETLLGKQIVMPYIKGTSIK